MFLKNKISDMFNNCFYVNCRNCPRKSFELWRDLGNYLPQMPKIRSKSSWCGCFQSDEPPEITYCVAEENGMLSLQAIKPTQPMPAQDELDVMFSELVEELDLTEKNKNAMLNLPIEKKWQLYCSKKSDSDNTNGILNEKHPVEHYVTILRSIRKSKSVTANVFSFESNEEDTSYQIEHQTHQLDILKTALRTLSNSFVIRFIEIGGLEILFSCLENMDCETRESSIHTSLIGCLKALMNNSTGRAHVLADEKHINIITQSLNCENIKSKIAILEILGAICLVANEHSKVLKAMDYYRRYAFEKDRFQSIVNDLDRSTGQYRNDVNLKTVIMSFINAILNYGTGKDSLEFRLHLRYEFLKLGIQKIIDKLRKYENDTLNRHLDYFEMVRNEDEREFSRKFDLTTIINENNLIEMFQLIQNRLSHTVAYEHLLSIFHHFLLLPLNPIRNYEHWSLFDRIVQQIVLQQNDELDSLVNDPDVAPITINVNDVIRKLVHEKEFQEALKKAECMEKENLEMISRLAKKEQELDVRIQEKEDLETSLYRLRERFDKELQAHIETKKRLTHLEDLLSERNERDECQGGIDVHKQIAAKQSNRFSKNTELLTPFPTSAPPPPPLPGGPPPPPLPINSFMGNASAKHESVKKNIPKPSNPVKSLNWSKLPEAKLHGTVWTELDDSKLYSVINLETIDKMFSAYQKNGNDDSVEDIRLFSSNLSNGVKTRNKILSMIDGRRAQNCTILLSKLKMSDDEISKTILSMDIREQLPIDMVEQLLKFTPTQEEISLLEEHSDDLDSLARADRFLYEISKITHYEQRLKSLHYKKRFSITISEIIPKMKHVMEASKEVSRSRKLKKLLEIVLALGNYMNRGARGNANGFKLCSLNRLIDTKSSSQKGVTLLNFLIEILEAKFKDVLRLNEDMIHVKEASKVSLGELEKEMAQLRSGLKEIAREIEFHRCQNSSIEFDRFAPVMRDFEANASSRLSELEDKFQDMKVRFDRTVRLFGEDSSTIQPDEFFGIFDTFLINFIDAKQDVDNQRKKREEDERRAKQESELRKLTVERKHRREPKANCNQTSNKISTKMSKMAENATCKNEFDDLISALRTGDVFGDDIAKMRRSKKRSGSNLSINRENSRERVIEIR